MKAQLRRARRRTEMASSSVMTTASQVIATSKHDHQLSCATRINSQTRRRRTAGEGLMCVTQDERAKNDSKWQTHTHTHSRTNTHTPFFIERGCVAVMVEGFGGWGGGGTMWQCVTSPPDKVSKQQRKHG